MLSVVVPLFNEEGNVAPLLERIVAIVKRLPGSPSYEIVLVNDGSTDATLDAIRAEMARRAAHRTRQLVAQLRTPARRYGRHGDRDRRRGRA